MDIKNANRMKVLSAISISLLVINLLGLCPSCLGQNNSCINIYAFENDLTTPKSTCGDGWTLGDLNHTGKKSYMSTQGISKFCTDVTGPATIEFWWYSNKIRNNKFLFRIDDKPETESYNSTVWEKKTRTLDKGDHTLSWTFYRGPNDNTSGWIDDLCIRQTSCNEECPTSGVEMKVTPAIQKPINVTHNATLNVSEKVPQITNATTAPCPVIPIDVPTYTKKEFYVIQGEEENGVIFPTITEAVNKVPPGSIIKVAPGTYVENVLINKPISLIGLNKYSTIVLTNERGFNITAGDVIVKEFTIKGGTVGIRATSATSCEFSDNIIDGSVYGVIIDSCMNSKIKLFDNEFYNNVEEGIRIYYSSRVNASSNIINEAGNYGINIDNSNDNKIMYNSINGSNSDGIYLDGSSNNNLTWNTFENIGYCDVIINGGINNTLDPECHNDSDVSGSQCISCDRL